MPVKMSLMKVLYQFTLILMLGPGIYRDLHYEKDVSYTVIHVPPQISVEQYIIFQFQINDYAVINLKCEPGCCFEYSAYCLTHRQLSAHGNNCMNISTYILGRDCQQLPFWRKRENDHEKKKRWLNFLKSLFIKTLIFLSHRETLSQP